MLQALLSKELYKAKRTRYQKVEDGFMWGMDQLGISMKIL